MARWWCFSQCARMLTFEIGSISGKWPGHSKGVRSSSKKSLISSSIEMFAAERGVRDNPMTCNHAFTWLTFGYSGLNENCSRCRLGVRCDRHRRLIVGFAIWR